MINIWTQQPAASQACSYSISEHAFDRRTGAHPMTEAQARQITESAGAWYHKPNQLSKQHQDLYAGLFGPVAGPTWVIYYNATQRKVNTIYEVPSSFVDVRDEYVIGRGYTELVVGVPPGIP